MQKPPTDRRRWDELSWLIGLCAASGRIADARPVSVLVVGPPGSGKTEMLHRYQAKAGEARNTMLAFASQASAWGVHGILKESVPRGVTHLVVPELQTLILRKNTVWASFIGLMLQAMEEGIGDTYNGPKKISYGNARLALIAGITTDAWYAEANELTSRGFTSRVLVCRWQRSPENTVASQLCANAGDRVEIEPITIDFPKRATVDIPTDLANTIVHYAAETDADNQRRTAKRLITLCKVIAVIDHQDHVTREHWDRLRSVEWCWRTQA